MKRYDSKKKTVLVAVLKNKRDQEILLREQWYRIPVAFAPKRRFLHLAFYQPACFGRRGKRIEYYAAVKRVERRKRNALLPRERVHAHDDYFQIHVGRITKLARPIKNSTPRRVSFGFTTPRRLKTARNLMELYHVAPLEAMVATTLKRAGIHAIPQYQVSPYRLDFAVFSSTVNIAIECDNKKAHSSKAQRAKDRKKDGFLHRHGWIVIRLKEEDILLDMESCINRIRGGLLCRKA